MDGFKKCGLEQLMKTINLYFKYFYAKGTLVSCIFAECLLSTCGVHSIYMFLEDSSFFLFREGLRRAFYPPVLGQNCGILNSSSLPVAPIGRFLLCC